MQEGSRWLFKKNLKFKSAGGWWERRERLTTQSTTQATEEESGASHGQRLKIGERERLGQGGDDDGKGMGNKGQRGQHGEE